MQQCKVQQDGVRWKTDGRVWWLINMSDSHTTVQQIKCRLLKKIILNSGCKTQTLFCPPVINVVSPVYVVKYFNCLFDFLLNLSPTSFIVEISCSAGFLAGLEKTNILIMMHIKAWNLKQTITVEHWGAHCLFFLTAKLQKFHKTRELQDMLNENFFPISSVQKQQNLNSVHQQIDPWLTWQRCPSLSALGGGTLPPDWVRWWKVWWYSDLVEGSHEEQPPGVKSTGGCRGVGTLHSGPQATGMYS